jgi:anti-anti-sigma regulatory factor
MRVEKTENPAGFAVAPGRRDRVQAGPGGRQAQAEESCEDSGGALSIDRLDEDGTVTLRLSGALDLSSLLRVRDEAFTAIGERPRLFCMDLTEVDGIEIAAIQTLVTIGRVARLVHVGFHIRPSPILRDIILSTGMIRMLPFGDEAEVGGSVGESSL